MHRLHGAKSLSFCNPLLHSRSLATLSQRYQHLLLSALHMPRVASVCGSCFGEGAIVSNRFVVIESQP